MQSTDAGGAALAAILALGGFLLVLILAFVALGILIWWKIFSKTGMSGWMGLLMFVPLANIIMLFVLAFSEWPVERELKLLRGAQPPLAPR